MDRGLFYASNAQSFISIRAILGEKMEKLKSQFCSVYSTVSVFLVNNSILTYFYLFIFWNIIHRSDKKHYHLLESSGLPLNSYFSWFLVHFLSFFALCGKCCSASNIHLLVLVDAFICFLYVVDWLYGIILTFNED